MRNLIITNIMLLTFYVIEVWHNHNLRKILDEITEQLESKIKCRPTRTCLQVKLTVWAILPPRSLHLEL